MSKGIRRPYLKVKSPFDAKRVIVAACAAVAMLLGATSVGASVSSQHEQTPVAEVSSIITSSSTDHTPSTEHSTGLNRRYTIGVRNFLQQQASPLIVTPGASKSTPKNPLSSIINSTVNPALFITQMVEMPGTQTSTSASDKPKDTTPATDTPRETGATDTTQPANAAATTDQPGSATSATPPTTPETTQSPVIMDVPTQSSPGE
jgi:hypothetical protein